MRIVFSVLIFLTACGSSTPNSDLKGIILIDEDSVEEENFEVIEEQEVEPTLYQLAAQKYKGEKTLPLNIDVRTDVGMFISDADFVAILKTYDNFFLTEFKVTATVTAEYIYYLTFDYNGNQLDAKPILTYDVDLDGEIVFKTDSTFQANLIIKQIEWDEADALEVGEPTRDTIDYLLTNNGDIKADIIKYYNKNLKRLFPTRVLRAQYQKHSMTFSSEAAEYVEGGAMSRKYLRIFNEYDLEIGVVMYEDIYSNKPFTLSIAILDEGNNLISSILCNVDDKTVLRLKSNKTGIPDKGPYDYNYYTYSESTIILQPLLTKVSVNNLPELSIEDGNTLTSNIKGLNK